jgi:hypothetical protein
MRKNFFIVLGGLLLVTSTNQALATSGHHRHKAKFAPLERQFLNSNDNWGEGNRTSASARRTDCQNREPGNPYSMQDDYQGWSAWRNRGGWDSHNDCW